MASSSRREMALAIGPMQRTAAPAALSAVPKALDPLLQLAEVQRLDLARTASAHRPSAPGCSRRLQRLSVEAPSPISAARTRIGSAYRLLASAIMATTRPMRSFFFRPVHAGRQLQVDQHILQRHLVLQDGILPVGLLQLLLQSLLLRVHRLGGPATRLIRQTREQRRRAPAPPTCSRSCGRPPAARPPARPSSARSAPS